MTALHDTQHHASDKPTYCTFDLSIFNTHNGNRNCGAPHVEELVASIREHGYLWSFPIVVNSNMEVIAGQHRLAAAKIVGDCGIYYVIDDSITTTKLLAIERTNKSWNSVDYLTSYRDQGLEPYVRLDAVLQELDTPLKIARAMWGGARSGGNTDDVFKSGRMKFTDADEKRLRLVNQRLKDMAATYPALAWTRKDCAFAQAISFTMFNAALFNWDLWLGSLKYQSREVVRCATRAMYLKLIQDIYNNKRQPGNRIKLVKGDE